jgi:sugar lactone lactonase YvrE
LSAPEGLAVDASGGLYVADTDNARVLYFPSGAVTASRVYGQQGSFTTNSPDRGGVSAQSLGSPTGLALDAAGGLYVADGANARVLFFPPGQTTASRVYGPLGDFTTGESNKGSFAPTAETLGAPRGLAVDAAGGLYVADLDNNRVLYYPAGSTTAARVYGQSGDFGSGEANPEGVTASGLNEPMGVAVGPDGAIYVADALNSRVLAFPAP